MSEKNVSGIHSFGVFGLKELCDECNYVLKVNRIMLNNFFVKGSFGMQKKISGVDLFFANIFLWIKFLVWEEFWTEICFIGLNLSRKIMKGHQFLLGIYFEMIILVMVLLQCLPYATILILYEIS